MILRPAQGAPPPLAETRLAGRSGPRSAHGWKPRPTRNPDRLTRMSPSTPDPRRMGRIACAIQLPRINSSTANASAQARVGLPQDLRCHALSRTQEEAIGQVSIAFGHEGVSMTEQTAGDHQGFAAHDSM